MVLASQAFTALIPLIILTSAILPTENHSSMADGIIRKFALTGDSAAAVSTVFAGSGSGDIGVLSIFLLVFSGVSLTRRLQRLYLEAYQLPRTPGVRGSLYAAVALGALLVEFGLLSFIRSLLRELPQRMGRAASFVFESEVLIEAGRRGVPLAWVPIPAIYQPSGRPSHFRPVADIALITRMVAWKLLSRGLYLRGLFRSLRGA